MISLAAVAVVSHASLAGAWRFFPLATIGCLVTSIGLIGTGVGLIGHSRGRLAGWGLVATGMIWPSNLSAIGDAGLGPFISWNSSGVCWGLLAVIIVSYPSDLRPTRMSRFFMGLAVLDFIVFNLLHTFISEPEWAGFSAEAWWPTLWPNHDVSVSVARWYGFLDLGIAAIGVQVLLQRIRSASGADRATLEPVAIGVSLAALIAGGASVGQQLTSTETALAWTVFVQGLGLLAIPGAAIASVHRSQRIRGDIANLVMDLSVAADIQDMRDALRRALKDDELEVLYHQGSNDGLYLDPSDRPVPLPDPASRLLLDLKTGLVDEGPGAGGLPHVLVSLDPRLVAHQEMVRSALSATQLAVDRTQLQNDLRDRLAELEASQRRLAQAGVVERRRIERNLHDGAQQRLVTLRVKLEHLRSQVREEDVRASLLRVKDEVDQTLEAIRQLARGIHPPLLTEGGLDAVLPPLLQGLETELVLQLPDERPDATTEAEVYFMISEALANVSKHANATVVEVLVNREGDLLRVEVNDDGTGGADTLGGSGLAGMEDRVRALGGTMVLISEPGRGTSVRISLPWRDAQSPLPGDGAGP
ncbi:sensor histidine kinase [Frankia tisae]|uniref:sensor histidine kinase n=1 Tax=Frankia tisae TaxID=2950104 RepID=UPI0021BE6A56|nr:sensor histidine kinase [Frankia tisae]